MTTTSTTEGSAAHKKEWPNTQTRTLANKSTVKKAMEDDQRTK
jgi:hypothetical protein